jgi:glycosyltransferase involved in cell wall biosynthesis
MRVGVFIHSFHPHVGGIERFALGHARLAQELGHEVHVYCPLRGPLPREERHEGISIHRFPEVPKRWPGLPHAVTRGMGAAARSARLGLLHAYEYRNGPPLVAGALRRRTGTPFVWSTAFHPAHRGPREERLRALYDATLGRRMVRSADVIAYLSRGELECLRGIHPVAARKPTARLPPVMHVAALQALAREGPEPPPLPRPYLVVLGRMERYKGARELVAALGRTRSGAHLAFVGALAGQERAELADHAARHGVAERVHALGALPEAAKCRILAQADGFVSASNYESFGIALVEALALGVPSLSTCTGVAPEVLRRDEQMLEGLGPTHVAERIDLLLERGKAGARQASPAEVDALFGPAVLRGALRGAYALAEATARA